MTAARVGGRLMFGFGERVPGFIAPCSGNSRFVFDSVAGRYVVLALLGSAAQAPVAEALRVVTARGAMFDDERSCFFGVTADPVDFDQGRVVNRIPGIRFFDDRSLEVSRAYRAIEREAGGPGSVYRPYALLLDPTLRVIAMRPIAELAALLDQLDRLPPPALHTGIETHAPVLIAPRVFEPEFCRMLIGQYEAHGGEESGFMRQIDGKTVLVKDNNFKRRTDHMVEDEKIQEACRNRILQRLVPEIQRAFNFKVTRMERYLVARYDSETGGHFRPHRDNTTKGTAHRRFAVSINLNAGEFEGGDLRFAEFGPRSYRPPTGGAVVFGCSLLHEVLPVTKGARFAFLPFLYDDEAAKIREANLKYLDLGGAQAAG